ncbi:transporter substrate-binding protein [Xylophilus rhododendri]|uniref:Transporter substrate-binding protein n=1 Tax=Xylophilus rhododendri TaxID=2697032 RepID=A0A857J1G0_9BURK|nr:transporter substrate-binding domain-containing protein [Xylophilus rhododendri]QHI96808.1 transporter substrate-binding protein [Xylophilus rhododendri]
MSTTQTRTWRVGVLFSNTGVTAAVERTQQAATLLAIEEINAAGGVLGAPIEPVLCDPASRPKRYGELARQLCDVEGVRVIFGCHMSSTRKAVLPVVEAHRALLFYPTLYEGFEYSPNCVYTGAAPNQNSVQLVRYLTQNFGKRLFLVGSDYVYPYESNRIIGDLFRQSGGQLLDELYVPLLIGESDMAKVIRRIKAAQPDVIYSTMVGDSIAQFYQAYREAGFDQRTHPIASQSTQEAEIAQMPPEVAEGSITAAPYFSTIDTPANRRFVQAWRQRFGPDLPITANAEAAYFQVKLYAQTLERAGDDRLDAMLPHLHEHEFDAPQGRVRIDKENHHTYLWPRVARVDAGGQFQVVDDPGIRVKPDPYMFESRFDPLAGRAA